MKFILNLKTLLHKKSKKIILHNIDLSFKSPQFVGINGQSGSGKTLLALTMSGLLSSEFLLNGRIQTFPEQSDILYLAQDPNSAFPVFYKIKQIWNILSKYKKVERNFFDIIDKFNLDSSLLQLYPDQLSGGEKQRFLIAMGISLSYDLIIFDEPTSALDKQNIRILQSILISQLSHKIILIISLSSFIK
jgi:ABC-type glutathione transport system ATPase component